MSGQWVPVPPRQRVGVSTAQIVSVFVVAVAFLVVGVVVLGNRSRVSATPRVTIERAGERDVETDQFSLEGDYQVDWTATDTGSSTVGCYHGMHLKPVGWSFTADVPAQQTKSGTSHVYGLSSGRYWLKAISGCKWTVTLTPI